MFIMDSTYMQINILALKHIFAGVRGPDFNQIEINVVCCVGRVEIQIEI